MLGDSNEVGDDNEVQNEVQNENNSDLEDDLEDEGSEKEIRKQWNRYICFHSSHIENEVSFPKYRVS